MARSSLQLPPLDRLLSLVGRRALITGAASGIGERIAARFAEAGARLVLVDMDESGVASTACDAEAIGCSVVTRVLDLSSKPEIDALWSWLADDPPDILVNNAGIYPFEDFLKVDEAFLERTLAVNLESVFWMCQGFIGLRLHSGGSIVNVSSIEAVLPFKEHLTQYAASKAGVIALTRGLARDYGRKGFRANVIMPGAIHTPGTKTAVNRALKTLDVGLAKVGYLFGSRLALGRWGEPDEVARVALFLASDLASYVQGAVVPVDGGFLSS